MICSLSVLIGLLFDFSAIALSRPFSNSSRFISYSYSVARVAEASSLPASYKLNASTKYDQTRIVKPFE